MTTLKNAGFSYFKIDFINNILKCDCFYDKKAGHYDALRKLIKTVLLNTDFESSVPDIISGETPEIWRKKDMVFVFNFSEETKEYTISSDGKYTEIFGGIQYESKNGALTLSADAHC